MDAQTSVPRALRELSATTSDCCYMLQLAASLIEEEVSEDLAARMTGLVTSLMNVAEGLAGLAITWEQEQTFTSDQWKEREAVLQEAVRQEEEDRNRP